MDEKEGETEQEENNFSTGRYKYKYKHKYKYSEDGEVIYRMNLEQGGLAVSPLWDFEQRLVGVVVDTAHLKQFFVQHKCVYWDKYKYK